MITALCEITSLKYNVHVVMKISKIRFICEHVNYLQRYLQQTYYIHNANYM